jgi:tetratricopeptide (TPR) repeat protein
LSQAVNTKAVALFSRGRFAEAAALLRLALDVALENDKPSAALRAYFNLTDLSMVRDDVGQAASLAAEGLALARRVGNRSWEWSFLGVTYPAYLMGDWDDVLSREQGLPSDDWTRARSAFVALLASAVPACLHRGQVDEARQFTRRFAELESSADIQELACIRVAEASLSFAEGRYGDALATARQALEGRHFMHIGEETMKEAFVVAAEAALEMDDQAAVTELLDIVDRLPLAARPPFLVAHAARLRARLAARQGEIDAAEALVTAAAQQFRELGYPFPLAVTLLEQGELLIGAGRQAEAAVVVTEAAALFDRLGAVPWSKRAARVGA